MKRCVTALIGLAVFLLTVESVFGQSPAPPAGYWLGEERGPYATGTIEELWVDSARGEPTTSDPNDRRHLLIQVWYPATFDGNPDRAPYVLSPHVYGARSRGWIEQVKTRRTNSVLDAGFAATEQPFPILIFNHGGAWPNFSSTFQTEFLASHGYVVVSIGHPGSDGAEKYPDGYEYRPDIPLPELSEEQMARMPEIEQYRWRWQSAEYLEAYAQDVADISFVLDELERLAKTANQRFYRRLDLERVGVLGWSWGGATAIQATVDEPRIKAAVNADGWLHGRPVESTGTSRPIMILGGTLSTEHAAVGEVDPGRAEFESEINRRLWAMLRLTEADWYKVAIVGADHPHFSDITAIFDPPPPGGIAPKRAHAVINALTLEFFDRYLKGVETTPLLSRKASSADIQVTVRGAQRR